MAVIILTPNVVGDFDAWALGAGASKVAAVTSSDGVTHDDDTSFIHVASLAKQSFTLQNKPTSIVAVATVKMGFRWRNLDSGSNTITYYMRLNGVDQSAPPTSTLGAASAWTTIGPSTMSRPGGGDWTAADIFDSTLQMVVETTTDPAADNVRVTSMWIELDYTPAAALVEHARVVGSMNLRFRNKATFVDVDAPLLYALDTELLSDVAMSHFAGPYPGGIGWGEKRWARRFLRLMSAQIDLESGKSRMTFFDVRRYLVLHWDTMLTKKPFSGAADGIARLSGGKRSFTRNSKAWFEDPSDRRIVEATAGTEKYAADGELLESKQQNEILNSSFKDGVSGSWTLEGTGINGSAIANDTVDLLFDSKVSANSCKMTAGNPLGGTDLAIRQTTASIPASTDMRFSVDHLDDSGAALSWSLQRSSDSNWWNDSTPGWQVGGVDNNFTVRSTKTRDKSAIIPTGASANTLTVRVKAKTTAGQINHVYHVQLERNRFPTSRIVTQTAVVTREADTLEISNNSDGRVWDPARGTFFCEIIPTWSSGDLPGTIRKIIAIAWHSNIDNTDEISYNQTTSSFVFRRTIGGTTFTATKATTVVAGTKYAIAARWTSDEGELDLANFTASIFVDGVKGTDATASSSATLASYATLHIGLLGTDTQFSVDAYVRHFMVSPFALTDEEIARLP